MMLENDHLTGEMCLQWCKKGEKYGLCTAREEWKEESQQGAMSVSRSHKERAVKNMPGNKPLILSSADISVSPSCLVLSPHL